MSNLKNSSSINILDEEIDRLIYLCTYIEQMATKFRLKDLTNITYSSENLQTVLSIGENIEGSIILLESLLEMQKRSLISNKDTKLKRFSYTREKLLELRNNVTIELVNDIGIILKQVVEKESNDSAKIETKSWRDIRTILM